MIVDTGLKYAADILGGVGPTAMSHLEVGTGTTTPTSPDTTLETVVLRKATSTSKVGDRVYRYNTTFGAGEANGSDLSEVGVFNAGAAGTMFNHTTFTPISKDNTFSLRMEIDIEVKEE